LDEENKKRRVTDITQQIESTALGSKETPKQDTFLISCSVCCQFLVNKLLGYRLDKQQSNEQDGCHNHQ